MNKDLMDYYRDKVVMVTGGTGSIGSEIVRELLALPVKQIRVFSRDEYKQFLLTQELKKLGRVSFLIGDIRDRDRVHLAMEGVDIVFNAAAMKHVPLCEYNPFEAVKTNVLGTQNIVDAARFYNIDKVIHVSTDKAAMPLSVMGATKLLAEKIAISAEEYKGKHKTIFCAIRFGNVFASRGSVVPVFMDQIKRGGPVTITHADMTRFMMSIPQAVSLMLQASLRSKGGELFILKMPVMRIEDMAKALIELYAPVYGHDPKKIAVTMTGRREGEKLYELLMTEEESENVYDVDDMLCITKNPPPGAKQSSVRDYRSDKYKAMDYNEVKAFLQGMDIKI
jgi:FlaA1/EpsC-like NDP-sugar epimerase